MSSVHGFSQFSEVDLPEYRATGVRAVHEKSGCEVFHVVNDDNENFFAFAFKTLPADSTGVAHILEHTVLCGSRRFPVKDPFVLLMRGSLNTFVNAMTYPDKTVYPASSTVKQDLFNIMDVYGDAVFAPLLNPGFFQQEGHRLQFTEDGHLSITGIVYNEMKGNYSSHDSVVADWAYRSLLPESPYGFDSGGDPVEIPNLSYEDFVAFHQRYYHPSNCRIFLYGDIPTETYLEFLNDRFLSGFSSRSTRDAVAAHPRWNETREQVVTYPADEDGATSVSLNWLLDPITNPDRVIELELLAEILLGTSAAPLRKRLIDSGVGEDLSASTGLETELYEMVFSVGLRAISVDKKDEVASMILDELGRLVSGGIDPDIVEAALRKVEFRNRELKGGPNGLRLMGRSMRGWLHGETPETTLRFEEPFRRLRTRVEKDPRHFENLILRDLLENGHRSLVTVIPDPQQQAREARAVSERLTELESQLSHADRERIRREQDDLLTLQQTADEPEAVAKIPFLKVSDLPTTVLTIPTDESAIAGAPAYTHDLFTNGVVYLDLVFDLSSVPLELMPYLPFFAGSIGELPLPGKPYDVVATEVALKTGGIGGSLDAAVPLGSAGQLDNKLYVRLKALESTLPEAVDLLSDLLLETRYDDEERTGNLWKEARSEIGGSVIPAGHRFAALRAGRRFSQVDARQEEWQGITQLLLLNQSPTGVGETLERIASTVLRRDSLVLNVTAERSAIDAALPHLERLVHALPADAAIPETRPVPESVGDFPRQEALIAPSDVSFVAAVLRGAVFGTADHAHELLLAHLLSTGYLWQTIRMTGGAYGAFAGARGMDGMFVFSSYRDPRIVETLQAYSDGLKSYAQTDTPSGELELAQIGVTGHDIRPMSPRQKGGVALRRILYGITDEMRQEKRDAVLSATAGDIRRAASRLHDSMEEAAIAVLGRAEAVDEAAHAFPGFTTNRVDIPL